jgi:hypothetical protein
MKINPNAPIERIVPSKAEVSVDSKTPVEPPEAATDSQHIVNSIDKDWVREKIEALSENDGRKFKRYCATFNPSVLPKGVQEWYATVDATRKICWLYLRFEAMRNPLFLSGHIPVRILNDDELQRCVHAVVSDASIVHVHQIQVLGFPLNKSMVRQVQDALQSSKLREYFPEVIARFDEVVR